MMMLACQVVRTIAGWLVADTCEPAVGDFEHGHLAEQSTAPHNPLAGQHGNSKAFERDVCLWCTRLYRSSVRRMPCAMRDLQSARVIFFGQGVRPTWSGATSAQPFCCAVLNVASCCCRTALHTSRQLSRDLTMRLKQCAISLGQATAPATTPANRCFFLCTFVDHVH